MKTWLALVVIATALTGCVLPPPGYGHGGHGGHMDQGHRPGPSGYGPHGGPGGHGHR